MNLLHLLHCSMHTQRNGYGIKKMAGQRRLAHDRHLRFYVGCKHYLKGMVHPTLLRGMSSTLVGRSVAHCTKCRHCLA